MIDLLNDCEKIILSRKNIINDFNCGDSDIDDFFNHDAILFQDELLGQTHYFLHKETKKLICAFSLCADSVKTCLLPNNRLKKIKELIPREKPLQSYPSYLIGRFGVISDFNGQGIGSQLLTYIKAFCLNEYQNFGRYLVVDAYNKPVVLSFYEKNGFAFVFSTEQQERENLKKALDKVDEPLNTRQMFYDLKRVTA